MDNHGKENRETRNAIRGFWRYVWQYARLNIPRQSRGLTGLLAVCLCAPVLDAASTAPATKPIDRSSLEDLGADLFDDLQVPLAPAEKNTSKSAKEIDSLRVPTNLDGPLFRKWSDQQGEDLGPPSAQSPLADIEAAMRNAQQLIAQVDSVDRGAEVQKKVVADLDALIAQLAKQCAACQGQCNGQCENPGSRRSQVAGSKPGSASAGRGTSAAQDSTARLDSGTAEAVDMGEMQDLLKDIWGQLPARVREQLLQAPTDEFLPKYQLEIEKYFRRLAEEGRQDELRP